MLKVRRKTNYVIACWDGNRRASGKSFFDNRSFFIASHIFALKEYKHNLDQITIVVPYNPTPSSQFENFLVTLPQKLQNANIVVVRRANYGLSYGSYAHAFALYKRQFDYFIFNEDDYLYVKDDFDLELIKRFNASRSGIITSLHWRPQYGSNQPVTYKMESVCGSVAKRIHARHDLLISNGITSNCVLEKIAGDKSLYNKNFHLTNSPYGKDLDQVVFEDQFLKYGPTGDLATDYCIPFNGILESQKPIKFFRNTTEKFFIVPVENVPTLLVKDERHSKLVSFINGF